MNWICVCAYGDGEIYARGNERKIVTPGCSDFYYTFIPAKGK